jgi:hypothetical protein
MAHEHQELLQAAYDLGDRILDSQVLDKICETDKDIDKLSSRILDSSWLFLCLESFLCRRLFGAEHILLEKSGYPTPIKVPNRLNDVPLWASFLFENESLLVKIAKGSLDANTDALVMSTLNAAALVSPPSPNFITKCKNLLLDKVLFSILGRLLPYALVHHYNLCSTYPFRSFLTLTLRGIGLVTNPPKIVEAETAPDKNFRAQLKVIIYELIKSDALLSPLAEELSLYISLCAPIASLEQRFVYWNSANKIFTNLANKKTVFTAIGLFYDFDTLLYLANAKAKGAKIIGIQHGGYYGYARDHLYVKAVELANCDSFLTWGWNSSPTLLTRVHSAKLVDSGSTYLRDLRERYGSISRDTPTSVLFCPTSHPQRPFRYDTLVNRDFMEQFVWPHESEQLALWLASNRLSVGIKWYTHYPSSTRQNLLLTSLRNSEINYRELDSRFPARKFFNTFQIAIWDSVGTGFFESIAAGLLTFLLPSAKLTPLIDSDLLISEHFFINSNLSQDLGAQFKQAMSESKPFLDKFGKIHQKSISDLLHSVNQS